MITFLILSSLLLFNYITAYYYSLILIHIHLHNLSVLKHVVYIDLCTIHILLEYNYIHIIYIYILISLAQQFISESHRQFYFS